jgi:hypothetical protein
MAQPSSILINKKINTNECSFIKDHSYSKPPLPPTKRNDILNEAFSQETSQPDKRAKIQVIISN